jgi:hypothetical protein
MVEMTGTIAVAANDDGLDLQRQLVPSRATAAIAPGGSALKPRILAETS